jgi:hypothetical protein
MSILVSYSLFFPILHRPLFYMTYSEQPATRDITHIHQNQPVFTAQLHQNYTKLDPPIWVVY